MADEVQIRVDTTSARLKLDRVTPAVRNQLRQVLPRLTRKIGASVESKMDAELKSRKYLFVRQELRESANQIYGLVAAEYRGFSVYGDLSLVPKYLEYGTKAHWVAPVYMKALHWTQGGQDFFSKGHQVSGITAHNFMSRTFKEMQAEVVESIRDAAKAGAKQV